MRKLAILLALVCVAAGAALWVIRSSHKTSKVTEKAHALKQAITPKPPVLTEAADPQHKVECETAFQSANQNGSIVKNWKLYGAHGNVRVRNAYYRTDLNHKRSLDKALRCVMAEGREEDQGLKQVTYRDAHSDELVAVWEKQGGFRMAE